MEKQKIGYRGGLWVLHAVGKEGREWLDYGGEKLFLIKLGLNGNVILTGGNRGVGSMSKLYRLPTSLNDIQKARTILYNRIEGIHQKLC